MVTNAHGLSSEITEMVNDQWVECMIELLDLEEKDKDWEETKNKNVVIQLRNSSSLFFSYPSS